MTTYTVTLVDQTPDRKRTARNEFVADPKLKNVFIVKIDQWRSIRVSVDKKPWWKVWSSK